MRERPILLPGWSDRVRKDRRAGMNRMFTQFFQDLKNKELVRIRTVRFFQELKRRIPIKIRIQRLHVFVNETDFYIAFDLDDAEKVVFDTVGETRLEMEGEECFKENPFKQMKDSTEISINFEPADFRPWKLPLFAKVRHEKEGDYYLVTAQVWAWILISGRGMLCSTEW